MRERHSNIDRGVPVLTLVLRGGDLGMAAAGRRSGAAVLVPEVHGAPRSDRNGWIAVRGRLAVGDEPNRPWCGAVGGRDHDTLIGVNAVAQGGAVLVGQVRRAVRSDADMPVESAAIHGRINRPG